MDFFTSKLLGFQPIFLGAGCLTLGYMYGKHYRSMIDNNHIDIVPVTSNAACNHVANHATVELEKMATSYSSDSILNYSNSENFEKPKWCGKRNVGQLEIFEMPTTKDNAIWAQTNAFKKQKGVPVITIQKKEVTTKSKRELKQDSDDETLAQRLEYFTSQSASITKSKNKKKEKSRLEVTLINSKGKDLISMDSQKDFSKSTTRSRSSLLGLVNMQGGCSLEDTCKSPKIKACLEELDHVQELDHVEELDHTEKTNFAYIVDVSLPCTQASELEYMVRRDSLEGCCGDDVVDLTDLQCELNGLGNNLDYAMDKNEDNKRLENAKMEDDVAWERVDTMTVENLEDKGPTNQFTKFHVQDRCLWEVDQEANNEHQVLMDKMLKVEIYELLLVADCAKVSFEEIVSLLEEKLKVVLREDKAHIVSLVREVINISKLLEEEKFLEG